MQKNLAHTNTCESETSRDDNRLNCHVTTPRTMLTVFFALVLLTILTVVLAQFALGAWEVWIALSIASLKSTLVALYFMHLRYDHRLYAEVSAQ